MTNRMKRWIKIVITIVGLYIAFVMLLPFLASYEVKLGQNAAMALAINVSASPNIVGASLTGRPSDYCQKNGDHLVVPYEVKQRSGNTYKPTSCRVAAVTLPNKYCSVFWVFRNCLAVYVPKDFYSLLEIRSAVEAAIADPCKSFSIEPEESRFLDYNYPYYRNLFKCSESITGNRFTVVVVLSSISGADELIEYPASRRSRFWE